MTRKGLTAIIMTLSLFAIVPIHAEIASKTYADQRDNKLIFGTESPSASAVSALGNTGVVGKIDTLSSDISGVNSKLSNTVAKSQSKNNALVVTNSSGDISLATGGFVTNSNISSNANIEMGKIKLPTPGTKCSSQGCLLMYYNNKYIWEPVERDGEESITQTGSVTASATSNSATTTSASSVSSGSSSGGSSSSNMCVEGASCSTHSDCGGNAICVYNKCMCNKTYCQNSAPCSADSDCGYDGECQSNKLCYCHVAYGLSCSGSFDASCGAEGYCNNGQCDFSDPMD